MKMLRRVHAVLVTGVLLAPLVGAAGSAPSHQEILQILGERKQAAKDAEGQAEALAKLAWLEPGQHHAVRAAARQNLVGYQGRGMLAIREVILTGPDEVKADAVAALIESNRLASSGQLEQQFLAGLVDALWVGNVEARRIALRSLQRYTLPPAVNPAIDSVLEYPQLLRPSLDALSHQRSQAARLFLASVILDDTVDWEERRFAAAILAVTGGRAMTTLRELIVHDSADVRAVAVGALLPIATTEDITHFNDYIDAETSAAAPAHPEVLARVQSRINDLERRVREELMRELERDAAPSGNALPTSAASGTTN